MQNPTRNRWEIAIPLLLFAGALMLRLIGIGWGLRNDLHSDSYHPDEPIVFGYSQAIEPTQGKFTPGFYNYGTLYLTVLKVATDMVATYTGGFDPKNPDSVYSFVAKGELAGRVLSALAGAGTVWVVFLILRRRRNLFGSVMGGLFVALAPAHVVHSRFATVDVVATFFVALSTHYALKFFTRDYADPPEEGQPKRGLPPADSLKIAALSGLFAGLAAGTKYTGGLVILTLVAAIVFVRPKTWMRDLAVGIGVMLLAFVVSTPGVLLDQAKFVKDFVYETSHTATGHGLIFTNTPSGFVYHLGNLIVGIGALGVVLGVVGLASASTRNRGWAIALLAFFVPYAILIGRAEVKFLRYTFPLYIGLACGFGRLMGRSQEKKGLGQLVVGAGILALGGVDSGGLYGASRYTQWMSGTDPRDAAARYLKDPTQVKPDAVVAYASDPWYYSVPLFKESAAPRGGERGFLQRMDAMAKATAPKAAFYYADPNDAFAFDVRSLDALKPEYVTYSTFESADLERLRDSTNLAPIEKVQVDRYKEYTAKLAKEYRLERVFGAPVAMIHDLEYIQPTIYVWKRTAP